MPSSRPKRSAALDTAERLLDSYWSRLLLSLLIIVSVLPEAAQRTLLPDAAAGRLDPLFLGIFGLELLARLAVYSQRWRQRRAGTGELLVLVLDLLAVLSFLPLSGMLDSQYLRLVRLTRLLLLLGYWGRMARELLVVLAGPERRYQVIGVLLLGLVLSFGSAVVVRQLAPDYDFDADGDVDAEDRRFFRILWWSFHQVQDTGYLVHELDQPLIVGVSLVLTFAGLLLFSLVIGIGTGAIEEVLVRSREQPLALHGHTVVLGLTPHSVFLLEGLAEIYQKNLRAFRAAVLGPTPEVPAYLHRPLLRAFQYRCGDPVRAADLDRVNIRQARRVLILGSDPRHPDGEVISAILATRERNARVDLYPDVEHERNFRAVRSAGGANTHLVGSGSFLGSYVVHNVVYPEAHRIYRQLLTPSGCEVYTYLFSAGERRRLEASTPASFDPAALHRAAYRFYGVTIIGVFAADRDGDGELEVLLNPLQTCRQLGHGERPAGVFDDSGRVRWAAVRGLAGISLRWVELRRLGRELIESPDAVVLQPGEESAPPAGGDARPASDAGFRSLALRPAGSPVGRVLISGASLRVPRVVAELTGFYPRLEVAVVLRDARRFKMLARGVEAALGEARKAPVEKTPAGDGVELRCGDVRVVILEGDWTDRECLRSAGAVDQESADAVLLLPGANRAEERDGMVALDCLHLANLERSGDLELRAGLHVLGMVRDAVKGDLLESRLEAIVGPDSHLRFTVISSERARHHFIMQNVFVRGLNPLYTQLLNAEGQHLSRLLPGDVAGEPPTGDFDPAELGDHLLLDRGLVFVGLELDDRDGEEPPRGPGPLRVELDPRKMPPGRKIPWRSVRAVYAVGSWEDLSVSAASAPARPASESALP